ncbi:MAG: hypothetical protein H0X33_13205 [Taibaiella sp.]|nr:hypothetical protein [Taibaiella sp.]
MDWGRIAIDADGNPLGLEDMLAANFDRSTIKEGSPALYVGKLTNLPVWDEPTLRTAIATENFAHPKMEEQINGWLNEGIESHALYEKVKEAKGLLTLKDVGLEEIAAPVEEPKAG